MAHSILNFVGDGATIQFPINFTLGILSRDYVTCQVNNEEDGFGDPVYRPLTWITDGLVEIGGDTPGIGEPIQFLRTMDVTELQHDYANGAAIEELNLDESNKQTLMAIHQFLDGRLDTPLSNDLDMGGHRIINLGDAVEDDDAATAGQIATVAGAAEDIATVAENIDAVVALAPSAAGLEQVVANIDEILLVDDNAAIATTAANAAVQAAAQVPLSNLAATDPPTANDDSGDGYSIGSRWLDVSESPAEWYVCNNATLGAAVWVPAGVTAEDLGALAALDTIDTSYIDAGTLVTEAEGIAANDNDTTIPTSAAVKDLVEDTVTALAIPAPGSSGNVQTSNGSAWTSAAPYVPPGCPIKIYTSANVTSGTAFALTSIMDSTYDDYIIKWYRFRPSNNLVAQPWMEASTNNGSSYMTASNSYSQDEVGGSHLADTSAMQICSSKGTMTNNSSVCMTGWLKVYDVNDTTCYKKWESWVVYGNSTSASGMLTVNMSGYIRTAAAINAFRMNLGAGVGTIAGGYFEVYGIKK